MGLIKEVCMDLYNYEKCIKGYVKGNGNGNDGTNNNNDGDNNNDPTLYELATFKELTSNSN